MSVMVALLTKVGPGFRFLRGRCEEGLDIVGQSVCFLTRVKGNVSMVKDR